MTLWMMVSDDELQLPLIVCDSATELAKKIGVTRDSVASCYCKYKKGQTKSTKYLKVEVDDD